MTIGDTITTVLVLAGVFLLAYAAIRHKDIPDILREIRDAVQGKAEETKDKLGEIKYA
jgi:hypothetical protein